MDVHRDFLVRRIQEFRAIIQDAPEAPAGLVQKLDQFEEKLIEILDEEDVNCLILSNALPKFPGRLAFQYLLKDRREEIESLGTVDLPGAVSYEATKSFLNFSLSHVFSKTEGGCSMLTNILLTRVMSVLSRDGVDVHAVPNHVIPSETGAGVDLVDRLVTQVPSPFADFLTIPWQSNMADILLEEKQQPNFRACAIFDALKSAVAEESQVRATHAAIAFCKRYNRSALRGVTTSGTRWDFWICERCPDGKFKFTNGVPQDIGCELENLPLVLGLLTDWVRNANDPRSEFFGYS